MYKLTGYTHLHTECITFSLPQAKKRFKLFACPNHNLWIWNFLLFYSLTYHINAFAIIFLIALTLLSLTLTGIFDSILHSIEWVRKSFWYAKSWRQSFPTSTDMPAKASTFSEWKLSHFYHQRCKTTSYHRKISFKSSAILFYPELKYFQKAI